MRSARRSWPPAPLRWLLRRSSSGLRRRPARTGARRTTRPHRHPFASRSRRPVAFSTASLIFDTSIPDPSAPDRPPATVRHRADGKSSFLGRCGRRRRPPAQQRTTRHRRRNRGESRRLFGDAPIPRPCAIAAGASATSTPPAGRRRFSQRLAICPRHHQHARGASVLRDHSHQSVGVELHFIEPGHQFSETVKSHPSGRAAVRWARPNLQNEAQT